MVSYYYDGIGAGDQLSDALRDILRAAPDIERALSRLGLGRGGPRDLAAIRDATRAGENLRDRHAASDVAMGGRPSGVEAALAMLGGDGELIDRLDIALSAELPLNARDGGFIAPGYCDPLDEQRKLRDEGRQLIADLQAKYVELCGVATLKIKHNNVLGYFIEVGAVQADKLQGEAMPFIHRQTLANQVRFTTTELSELVGRITLAQDKALAIETDLFAELTQFVELRRESLLQTGRAIAELDVAASLAVLAASEAFCRPRIDFGRGF